MTAPKISVIVPIYNTGRYIVEAIQSVRQQGVADMEIICVNDGSTDDSLIKLEELASQDSRIRIVSQANQGQSVARNTGMQLATGEYIYFMDSDDILKEGCFITCLAHMEKMGYDFVFFDADVFCEEGTPNLSWTYERTGIYKENRRYQNITLMYSMLDNYTFRAVPWLLFIRHQFIKQIGLSFYPGIIHEDELYTTLLTLQSDRIGCIKQSFVKHRVRANSTITHGYKLHNVSCYLTVIDELMRWGYMHPTRKKVIQKYARYTLDKVFYTAHVLPLTEKWGLARTMLRKRYTQYVSFKTWLVFLLK